MALVHLDAIYRAALRLIRDPTEAQDLSQEVFVVGFQVVPLTLKRG